MEYAVRVGSGRFTYDVVEGFEKLPSGYSWTDAAAVVVDSQDRVYVFNRGDHPMIVFDRDGNFLSSWGEGVFSRAHGVTAGPDDTLYCVDDGDHTVRQCTLDGEVLMTLGVHEEAGAWDEAANTRLLTEPTDLAFGLSGEIYVTVGHGNGSPGVMKFDSAGTLLTTWGSQGTGPGEFDTPH
ncbi:MAG: hypothetical protein QF652_08320, partial [Dehalococcoidia bacterium]|nr:hypothetical protein [Dehalococcoidia bacterium]